MPLLFFVCLLGMIGVMPLHFLSVEHVKLQDIYERLKGAKIGEIYGLVSGWAFFLFWIGIWVSSQPRLPILLGLNFGSILVSSFSIPILYLAISISLILGGSWLAISGLGEVTLRVAETHRTNKIVTTGVYSIVRHPQYLGGLLAHVGISFLLSAMYSLLSTPVVIILIFLMSRKEEEELVREFGEEYERYQRTVRMFIPEFGDLRTPNRQSN